MEHEQHISERAELSACSINRLVHLGIYKGGAHSDISTGTQGEYEQWNVFLGKRISWFTLCPWCQRGRVIWYCCHQVQRGRLLELWCMCCTWWQPTRRRSTHLYISRWIYRRDIRCDRMHGMPDNSKESDDSSQYDKLAFPSSPKGEIVGIMRQVLSLMANHTNDKL